MLKQKIKTTAKLLNPRFIVILLLVGACFLSLGDLSAQQHERPSNFEAIPGAENGGRTDDLMRYLEMVYKFGIGIAILLAFFMVSYGAFSYMVTSVGNASKMADAKSIIIDAIIGLVMALTAWLILFIINPDLVGGKTNIIIEDNFNLPDDVCEGEKDGSTAGGACKSLQGIDLGCHKGKCVAYCYHDNDKSRPYEEGQWATGKVSRDGTHNTYKCYKGNDGIMHPIDIRYLEEGKGCGTQSSSGEYSATCMKKGWFGCPVGYYRAELGSGDKKCSGGKLLCCIKDSYDETFLGF